MAQLLQLIQENQQLKELVSSYRQAIGASPYVDDSIFKGGYRVVKTIACRDAIQCCWRKQGMKVVVIGEDYSYKEYTLLSSNCNENEWQESINASDIAKKDYTWFINQTGDYEDKKILVETDIQVDETSTEIIEVKDKYYLIEVGTTDGRDSFYLGFLYNQNEGYHIYRQNIKSNLLNYLETLPFNSIKVLITDNNKISFLIDSIKDIRIKISGGEKDLANDINLISKITDYTNITEPSFQEVSSVYNNNSNTYNEFINTSQYSDNVTGYYFNNYKNSVSPPYKKGLLVEGFNGIISNINKIPIELLPYSSNGRNLFSNTHTVVGGYWSYGVSPDKIERTNTGFKVLGLISSTEMCVKTRINFNKETMKFITVTGKLIGDYNKIDITIGPQNINNFPTPYTRGEFYIFPDGNFVYTFNLGRMIVDHPTVFTNPTWFDLLFHNKGINNDGNAVYEVKYLKIEEGELSTPWSPAYEDFGGGGANISNTDLTNTRPRIFTQNASFTWDTLGNPYYLKGLTDQTENLTQYGKVLRIDPTTKQVAMGDSLEVAVTIPDNLTINAPAMNVNYTVNHIYPTPVPDLPQNLIDLKNFMATIATNQYTKLLDNEIILQKVDTVNRGYISNGVIAIQSGVANNENSYTAKVSFNSSIVMPSDKNWIFIVSASKLPHYNFARGLQVGFARTSSTDGVQQPEIGTLIGDDNAYGFFGYGLNYDKASQYKATIVYTKVGSVLNITVAYSDGTIYSVNTDALTFLGSYRFTICAGDYYDIQQYPNFTNMRYYIAP